MRVFSKSPSSSSSSSSELTPGSWLGPELLLPKAVKDFLRYGLVLDLLKDVEFISNLLGKAAALFVVWSLKWVLKNKIKNKNLVSTYVPIYRHLKKISMRTTVDNFRKKFETFPISLPWKIQTLYSAPSIKNNEKSAISNVCFDGCGCTVWIILQKSDFTNFLI